MNINTIRQRVQTSARPPSRILITWPFDAPCDISYWWSIGTEPLSPTVYERTNDAANEWMQPTNKHDRSQYLLAEVMNAFNFVQWSTNLPHRPLGSKRRLYQIVHLSIFKLNPRVSIQHQARLFVKHDARDWTNIPSGLSLQIPNRTEQNRCLSINRTEIKQKSHSAHPWNTSLAQRKNASYSVYWWAFCGRHDCVLLYKTKTN